MVANRTDIQEFVKFWSEDFRKTCEMASGVSPVLNRADEGEEELAKTSQGEDFCWIQMQIAFPSGTGAFWVGCADDFLTACLSDLAPTKPEREETFRGLLDESLRATVKRFGGTSGNSIQTGGCRIESGGPSEGLRLEGLSVVFNQKQLSPILLGFDAGFVSGLAQTSAAEARSETSDDAMDNSTLRRLADFAASDVAPKVEDPSLNRLADVKLPVAVCLGSVRLPMSEVLKATSGSVIELDQQAGDLVEIRVQDVLVARGEVVSIDGNYGVRLKEVLNRPARLSLDPAASRS
jgi:flagellar motor switch protein FliN/FliY